MAQNYLFVQTTPMSNLTLVPLEILTQIFGLLEGHQIARCGAVCSYFKRIVEGSSGLQYLIKLAIFGYTDASESVDAPASAITRLNRLERRIDAWNHLDWVESRVDAPLPSSDFGIICEGVFAMFDYRRVYCIQLPHLMRGIPFREWTLKKFSFPIHEIEIDPSSNLLVVVSMAVDHPDPPAVKTVTLHLRTLSDNSPHPRAISPILFSVRIDRGCPMIRVMGRLLGVTLCFRRELRVEIWDWTIGEKLTVVEDMRDLDSLIGSYCPFEFLSATSLVVIHQGVLEVYEIRVETLGSHLFIPRHFACRARILTSIVQLFGGLRIHICRTISIAEISGNVRHSLLLPSGWLRTLVILPSTGLLDGFFYPPRVIYDDEHMVFWTPHHSVVPGPGGGGDEDGDEDEDVDYAGTVIQQDESNSPRQGC
ncbi:hypothetical protein BS47DRAFT_1384011 [Hydnum rufescens UP504]|uniref:F-box domain-containing protein n=1 Tax=Hydnum rufescens UP504 TaxID=1448309 RepID=A0A9P6DT95_9AGAM|nr:hypothetical protein BS47DRAFT_1384011 [Hydnum rufescens UP504]